MKIKSTSEESKRLDELIKEEKTIEVKLKYYKNQLLTYDELYKSIQERIKNGSTKTIKYLFKVIPIIEINKLDSLDIARLKRELIEIEFNVFCSKQYYEAWIDRQKERGFELDRISIETNKNFDKTLEEAKKLTHNIRLVEAIKSYENETDHTQTYKDTFYLGLKQEINNYNVSKNKKRY